MLNIYGTSYFNELFNEEDAYKNDTVYNRIKLYSINIDKLRKSEKKRYLEIGFGSNKITLANSPEQKIFNIIVSPENKDIIENNCKDEIEFSSDSNGLFTKKYGYSDRDKLVFDIENKRQEHKKGG